LSLPHTILGFLNQQDLTGYDLKKIIDSSTQFFWHAELSQIYPTLKRLESRGLITSHRVPQEGKPEKKVYSITEAGRSTLEAWLREPLEETPPTKSPVLLKLFFLESLGREEAITQMARQVSAQRRRLKHFREETVRQLDQPGLPSKPGQAVLWELIRQYGELQAQTSIRWLEMAIEKLEKQK